MARETQPPPSSGRNPFGLPGLPEHGPRSRHSRGYRLHGDPRFGAALEAPTAPHATSTGPQGRPKKLSGPARFWNGRGVRLALTLTFVLSAMVHWVIAPWKFLPSTSGIEFKDPEGELSIPVDLLGAEEPPPEPAPPPPVETPPPSANDPTAAGGKPDAGGKQPDAGEKLAAIVDAGGARDRDGGAPKDAGEADGGGITDAGLVAVADAAAGPGVGGPRDPESMFGLSKVVNAGAQNVVLGVNVALVRKHPVGSRMGPILQAIPQWKDFLKGAPAPVDPIRDTDWLLIYGPSLIHTDKDAVLVRYNVPDDTVDTTIAGIAKSYDKGGPYDAGVPGIKASLGYADNAQRVFLRPQPKLLVIVPPSHAREAALTYRKQAVRGPSPTEAMRLIVHNPANQISIPKLKFPTSLTEIRLWIIPRDSDGGADIFGEGDCTDAEAAADTADKMTTVLRDLNSIGVKIATHGLLNGAAVVPDGSKVTLHVRASEDQLESILNLVAGVLNVQVAPSPHAAPAATPHRE